MENIFWQVAIILLGLFVGSFLNVAILRMQKNEKDWYKLSFKSRSRCPYCKKTLVWYDLIPILSFFILGGRCRYCKKPISAQYPLVELSTAILFYLIFQKFGLSYQLAILLPLASILLFLFVYDLRTMYIPDLAAWLGISLAMLYVVALSIIHNSYPILLNSILAAAIAGGFFALLVFVSRERWMGKGDIKIGIILGLVLGYPQVLVGLFLAFTLGAIISGILLGLKTKTLKSQVPFGPFLIAGIFLTLFWGEKLLNWYLNIT